MNDKPQKIRYMKELLPQEQRWLALAVLHIMMSDEIVDKKEGIFLKQLVKVFSQDESNEVLNEIKKFLREKELPTIDPLQVDSAERLIFMLNTLCLAIFANEYKHEDEVKSYFQAGLKLGMTYEILMLKLSYQKERFRLKQAQKKVDEDIRELVSNRSSS